MACVALVTDRNGFHANNDRSHGSFRAAPCRYSTAHLPESEPDSSPDLE
jgi:hypothetical protein